MARKRLPQVQLPSRTGKGPSGTPQADSAPGADLTTDEQRLLALRDHFRHVPSSEAPEAVAWRSQVQGLLDTMSPDVLPHYLVRKIEHFKFTIRRGLSFKAFMVQESESRRLGLRSPSWALDQKVSAYRFIDKIGIRRPESDLKTYKFQNLPVSVPAVVKPRRSTGSNGCYLIYTDHDIRHVRDGAQLSSFAEMTEHAESLMDPSRTRRPLPNRWIAEELILEDSVTGTPARDLKYFFFYGELLFFLEVRRKHGKSEYSFMTPDQTSIVPGDWDYEYFDGDGSTSEETALAQQISMQIPHPFCRIDMLKSESGMVFGEFTPRPGAYNRFSAEWDRRMGEAWARAQHRLEMDLLAGKRFDPFLSSTKLLDHTNTQEPGNISTTDAHSG